MGTTLLLNGVNDGPRMNAPSLTSFSVHDADRFGSALSSQMSKSILRPLMPPWSFTQRKYACAAFAGGTPRADSPPDIGKSPPILIVPFLMPEPPRNLVVV